MEKTNNKLRSEIETSFNQELQEQLRKKNNALINQVNQHFSVLQTAMLQIVKVLVQKLVISTNQNTTNQNQPTPPTPPFTNAHLTSSLTIN